MSFMEIEANAELRNLWLKSLRETWTPRLPGHGNNGGPLILSNDVLFT